MYGDKVVVLVRNPYKVIVSYWRHMTYGIHSDTRGADAPKYWPMPPRDNNKMFKPEDLQSEQFQQFVLAIIDENPIRTSNSRQEAAPAVSSKSTPSDKNPRYTRLVSVSSRVG